MRTIKLKPWQKSISRPIPFCKFASSPDDDFPPLVACLIVLVTDLRLELAGIKKRESDYSQHYFLRRLLISLVEIGNCIREIKSKHISRVKASLNEVDLGEWIEVSRDFQKLVRKITPLRHGVSAHFGFKTANDLGRILAESSAKDRIGFMEINQEEGVIFPFAGELAVLAFQAKCPDEDFQRWSDNTLQSIGQCVLLAGKLIRLLLGHFLADRL